MKKITLLFLMLSISYLLFIGCESQAQENNELKSIKVKMVEVVSTELQTPINTSGLLAAKEEVLLSFKTGGVIKNIFVDAGQKVKKGQLLAQLDLEEISSYREQAESALAKAKRDMARIENLYNEKVVTLEQKQNVKTALDVARSNAKIASFNEQHSKIYAPTDGKILSRFAEKNELTSQGRPILSFGSTNEAFVLKVGVSDKDVVKLQLGDPATLEFDAFPGSIFNATVSQIAAGASKGSGTFEVELQLATSKQILYSGFIGKAKILPQKREQVSIIPIESLLGASGKSGYVFKIDGQNIAKKQKVKISLLLDDQVVISEGLEGIDKVAGEGNDYLTSGSLVTIIN
ncbi:MAG: efflux RND transporter periplasmic adaptor subunit [Calditrichaeota bacterium]|nr:efflux RND transporter periplasmic adaptor subunit [Calditrichota bacterium]